MQNLTNKQRFIAAVAASVGDTDPHNCALMRATGGPGVNYFNQGVKLYGFTPNQVRNIAVGWDSSYLTPDRVWKGSDLIEDNEYQDLGQQAFNLVFPGGALV